MWWKSNWWASNWWASNWWHGSATPAPTPSGTPATHGMIEGVGSRGGYLVKPQQYRPGPIPDFIDWPKEETSFALLALLAMAEEEL